MLVDMKLEVVVIPVSDVDRAKEFYERLGWRLDGGRLPVRGAGPGRWSRERTCGRPQQLWLLRPVQ
jgi:catechol 2,3-dioxygenase-like lactoylglutathione lyase family enzyme